MREAVEFAADEVGGEPCAQQRTIQRRDLLLVDFAAKQPKLALDSLPDQRSWIGACDGFLQSGFDVAIWDAACTQVSRDTVGSLFPVFRAMANELFGVARVIQEVFAFQTLNC